MKENETKCNELVYQGSKSHGLSTTVSFSSQNESHANNSAKKSKGLNLTSIKLRSKQNTFIKPSKILHYRRHTSKDIQVHESYCV